mgnify:CR=1 FL=1
MNLSAKIELLIQAKKLSASQFADTLGIPRSSISHILSGRNKPSLDVVQKILIAFPEIPAEELLDDKRDLSISAPAPKAAPSPIASTPSLFDCCRLRHRLRLADVVVVKVVVAVVVLSPIPLHHHPRLPIHHF